MELSDAYIFVRSSMLSYFFDQTKGEIALKIAMAIPVRALPHLFHFYALLTVRPRRVVMAALASYV